MDINELLTRSVTNIISSKESLKRVLESEKKLNIYFGIDPTATTIHLGNAVSIRKLQAFSELGHNVTFLIGDFTALIGDTSDKESERPILSEEQIRVNFKTYKKQAEKLLDFSKIKVVHNSEWLKKLSFSDIIKLTQHFSLGDFIGRELIKKRLNEGKHIRLDEALYPVMQGYDSYFMDTDIQIGGADQTFNMQAGRILQKDFRKKESFVVVTGYLEGTDGRKMSKTWGNAIWLEDDPDEMYGKVMSVKDTLIEAYLTLATSIPIEEVKQKVIESKTEPMEVKKFLARRIVKELHSESQAKKAQENFENTFQKKAAEYNQEVVLKGSMLETLSQTGKSRSELKRLIVQGAVDINGKVAKSPQEKLNIGDNIKVGERTFLKIVDA